MLGYARKVTKNVQKTKMRRNLNEKVEKIIKRRTDTRNPKSSKNVPLERVSLPLNFTKQKPETNFKMVNLANFDD